MAHNERGAGRKQALSKEMLQEIHRRHEAGETVTALAGIYGVSRQTLHRYLKESSPTESSSGERLICRSLKEWQRLNRDFPGVDVRDYTLRMDYMNGGECCSRLLRYEPVTVSWKGRLYRACRSRNFLREGEELLPLEKLYRSATCF